MGERIGRRRVEEQLKRLLTQILMRRLKDPALGPVTVTRVELTEDLRHGHVYVSSVGDREEGGRNLAIVRGAAGWIRGEIGRGMRLRRAPELHYHEDETLSAEARITELLTEAEREGANGE